MDHVLVRVKGLRKKPYRKLISDYKLFETVDIDVSTCIPYNPDHNLDEDAWFKVEQFSLQPFSIGNFNSHYDSKNYDDLTKDQFNKIAYIISVQGDDFYFQKITSSLFIKRKTVVFGEVAKVEESTNRLVINSTPDAIYFTVSDTLIFRNLVTISSIFPGIDILYKEATKEEVKEFLGESFIALANEYNVEKVSKPNRKRVALAMATLETMSAADRASMLKYIESYCEKKLKFDHTSSKFEISTDDELKLLLYGIEKRFYTTYDGHERRLANSVQPLN